MLWLRESSIPDIRPDATLALNHLSRGKDPTAGSGILNRGISAMDWDTEKHPQMLIAARKRDGMERADLADKLGVVYQTVFNWETGKGSPQKAKLDALIELFGEQAFDPETIQIAEGGPTQLAAWLSEKRTHKGWTKQQLAAAADLTYVTIWNIESGRSQNPQRATLERLETALGEPIPDEIAKGIKKAASVEIEGVGEFTNFEPHIKEDLPKVPGVYVLYDISDRPLYVGQAENIAARISNAHTGHWDKFWYREPIVYSGAYIRIDEEKLRKQIEGVMIKFMKSNAVINKQGVERE
jgi:transcriptional regulator with XRE-family HTH domain